MPAAATKSKTTLVRRVEYKLTPEQDRYDYPSKKRAAERREFFAAEAKKAEAEGFITSVVGIGSYQTLNIYRVEQVAARIQLRGTCQRCGGHFSVDEGPVHLHGYKRPRWGFLVGRCTGSDQPAAEKSVEYTKKVLREIADALPAAETEHEIAVQNVADAAAVKNWMKMRELEVKVWEKARRVGELRDYAAFLTKNVLTRKGKPLYEVKK